MADRPETCRSCLGTGDSNPLRGEGVIGYSPCPECNGTGRRPAPAPVKCEACKGSGADRDLDGPCWQCGGKGFLSAPALASAAQPEPADRIAP